MSPEWSPDPELPPWWFAGGIAIISVGVVFLAGVLIGSSIAWFSWAREASCGL